MVLLIYTFIIIVAWPVLMSFLHSLFQHFDKECKDLFWKMHREIQKMREIALVYLDRSGGLQKFVHDCKKYNGITHSIAILLNGYVMLHKSLWFLFKMLFAPADSKQSYAVYRFVISINPSDIAELDATLGNYILHNPIQAAQIFQTVSYIFIDKSRQKYIFYILTRFSFLNWSYFSIAGVFHSY